MVAIKPICRQCFSQQGYSMELLLDPTTGDYVCRRDSRHRFKKEEDGTFTSV